MDFYPLASLIMTLAIIFAYINHRFIKMQTTIAVMAAASLLSLFMIVIIKIFNLSNLEHLILTTLGKINFEQLLINGMLSFLLFAGALTIDIHTLRHQKWEIIVLAFFSTILSTFLVAVGIYYLLILLNIPLTFIYCLLFGALISPTDPIAVLAIFKQLGAPRLLSITVAGESLFNDGVGIVLFLSIYQIAFAQTAVTVSTVVLLFIQQALGGIIYGLILGFLTSWLIKFTDDHKIEILLTIAVVTGGYALAQALHFSGPLAMVVAGIVIGTYARKYTLSRVGQNILDEFWELIDEILNCVLFLLIGFELLLIAKYSYYLLAGICAIPIVLIARYLTVAMPISLFKLRRTYCPYMITILVWGGLRGGLALALALALPVNSHRELLLALTYAVVFFAVIIQGATIKPLIKLTATDN